MNDIEGKIRNRIYQSPSRARAAVVRSHLGKAERALCMVALREWESEGVTEPPELSPIVGGVPELVASHVTVTPDQAQAALGALTGPTTVLAFPLRVNLNALIRARLTPYGISRLYDTRHRVGGMPVDLMERGGWWTTTLARFMTAMGDQLEHPISQDVVTVEFCIEILDPVVKPS